MKKGILLFFIFLPIVLMAQLDSKKKTPYQLTVSTGMVAGVSGVKPIAQFSGGFRYESLFYTGIGAGYDGYRFNSFPVFVDWQMQFGKKRQGFVYVNAGYAIPGSYKSEENFGKQKDELRGGLYTDAGIGYRIAMGKTGQLFFSGGYSQKKMTRKEMYVYPCFNGPCDQDPIINKYQYALGRIIVKAGWVFGN